jgi:hypothetical protein
MKKPISPSCLLNLASTAKISRAGADTLMAARADFFSRSRGWVLGRYLRVTKILSQLAPTYKSHSEELLKA